MALDPKPCAATFFLGGFNEHLLVVEGAVSVPIGTRVEIDDTDWIVHNVRLRARPDDYDLYYECTPAEKVGTKMGPLGDME